MSFRRSLGLAFILGGAALAARVTSVGAQRPPDLKGLARQSLSKLDGDVSVPGVREPAEIIRDTWGVTHIYAKNQDDLFFTQGFVQAQEMVEALPSLRRRRLLGTFSRVTWGWR